jgi:hypothetical protein
MASEGLSVDQAKCLIYKAGFSRVGHIWDTAAKQFSANLPVMEKYIASHMDCRRLGRI